MDEPDRDEIDRRAVRDDRRAVRDDQLFATIGDLFERIGELFKTIGELLLLLLRGCVEFVDDRRAASPPPSRTIGELLLLLLHGCAIDGLYCVGDSCFPGQGVIVVAFSGVMRAHRVAADIGLEKNSPILDAALLRLLGWLRALA
ncbi:hypothetical protein TEA_023050 [Camellia sinensis var. sinensis]|uniref:Uncharacterized protein n=1 Tax=Camellia sinensis var. sinensis TaxID=542762 RepID=A0A4S4ENK7_CAMSN|nr:hypothetical protein TEA_023050 [Camellia sinensis var. sinensis]